MYSLWFLIYLGIINAAGALVFAFDKHAATKGHWRIPERTLHLLEGLGGVFSIIILIYGIKHKKHKLKYCLSTWAILIIWLLILFLISNKYFL